MPPHHPPLPFPLHIPLSAYFSPRTSQPNTELASVGGERGGKQRSPEAPLERPQRGPSRPLPPGTDAQSQEGSRAGASVAHRVPGWQGRGIAAFVPGALLPLLEKLKVRANARDVQGWGRYKVAVGLRPLPSLELTQKGVAETYKVCVRKVVRDPRRGRTQKAAASSREEEGGGDRAGKCWWGCEGKVKCGGKG